MESKESHKILMQLRRAKEEVERLSVEYRKVCECNEKIPGVKFEPQSYQKMYKTCRYHQVTFSRHAGGQHYANV